MLDDPAYGTFVEPLLMCVLATKGPVLEVGAGEWSTPLLHMVCAPTGRGLVTVEDNRKWAERSMPLVKHGHVVRNASYDVILPELAKSPWAVVFIDHSPGERRGPDGNLFAATADYVVVHDWEHRDTRDGFKLSLWRHCIAWRTTAVLTNLDVPVWRGAVDLP